MAEFHDLAELALNRHGQSWGNLGYWRSATDYSDACRALALMLGEEAGLDRQSRIFDAGFGCGDQLLLWLDHFRVAAVGGVNLSRSQTAYARGKLETAGHPGAAAAISQGDINDLRAWSTVRNGKRPSHVIALDCAYHFPSRLEFLALAHRYLAPAGRLAMTDFVLANQHDTASFSHWLLRRMLKFSRIAEGNMVHRDRYRCQLQEAGFVDIRMIDISEHVMPGLLRFVQSLRRDEVMPGTGKKPSWFGLLKYRITGRFLEWAYRRSILRYCLIIAAKTG